VIHVGTAVALPNMTKIMILADYYSVIEKVHSFFPKFKALFHFTIYNFLGFPWYYFPSCGFPKMFCSFAHCKSYRK